MMSEEAIRKWKEELIEKNQNLKKRYGNHRNTRPVKKRQSGNS